MKNHSRKTTEEETVRSETETLSAYSETSLIRLLDNAFIFNARSHLTMCIIDVSLQIQLHYW